MAKTAKQKREERAANALPRTEAIARLMAFDDEDLEWAEKNAVQFEDGWLAKKKEHSTSYREWLRTAPDEDLARNLRFLTKTQLSVVD